MSAPEKLTIETPEQISLEYALASAGSRFLALAADTFLQFAIGLVVLLFAFFIATVMFGAGRSGVWVIAALVLIGFVLFYGYFAIFEAVWNGQTPGKRLVGLRVITLSGRPVGPLESIIRNLLRIVDQMPGIYAVGIVTVFLTAKNQRLGDLAAGTVVVHEQSLQHREHPSLIPGGAPLGAHRLQAGEVEAMETFLKRRDDLPLWRRNATARELAGHIRARLNIPTDRQPSDEALLEELVTEFRRRGR